MYVLVQDHSIWFVLLIYVNFSYYPAASQTIWISDGSHSVHMLTTTDMENGLNKADENDGDEKLMHFSGLQISVYIIG
jgi:hypothetical protein